MGRPDWSYDDLKHVGIDFSAEDQVATYDLQQGADSEDDLAILRRCGLEARHRFADIGCGTGLLLCAAAQHCEGAVGIDISQAMLDVTQRRIETLGLGNVQLVKAGFLSATLPDSTFDVITSKFALHHLPDLWKGVALARMFRALKPGGKLFLRDVVFSCSPSEFPAVAESWLTWMSQNTGYSREETATHVREEHSTYAWIMEGLIRAAGFNVLVAEHSLQTYADYIAEKPV